MVELSVDIRDDERIWLCFSEFQSKVLCPLRVCLFVSEKNETTQEQHPVSFPSTFLGFSCNPSISSNPWRRNWLLFKRWGESGGFSLSFQSKFSALSVSVSLFLSTMKLLTSFTCKIFYHFLGLFVGVQTLEVNHVMVIGFGL
ncbi:hypothetical protein RHMOL_Rhmol09G0223500 [Rhododendron molle]|uniref:Uncharacterized protein n=1 Tax=Rhododendron molle TaxID=49168 RepID=A0ACC0MG66_RHOML|nr:hypothetical protein RHMOL_Rhmol09G0223500 [Rhododendron molle]